MVAQAAQRAGDGVALSEALAALRALAPDRPAGRLAVSVAMAGRLEPPEAMDLLPYALAGAGDEPHGGLAAAALRRGLAADHRLRGRGPGLPGRDSAGARSDQVPTGPARG